MELTFVQITAMNDVLTELANKSLPFKLSLIIAKNCLLLQKEIEFFIEQERTFAEKYLEKNEDGTFVQQAEGVFKIKEGLEEECREAREQLDSFTSTLDLRMIPVSLVENLELTPKQVVGIEPILEED